jgi:hypothetical protein
MIKRLLPLMLGLSIGSVAIAQNAPAAAPTTTQTTQTTVTTWTTDRPTGALTQDAIETAVANAGYKEVRGMEFKDGVWRTKARGGDKKWVKLAIGPVSGKVYPADAPSKLNKDEVNAKLTTDGYQNVTDIKFDEGLWSAEAKTPHGNNTDLLVDPTDGSVVAKSRD